MYQIQEKPDSEIIFDSGGKNTPLATLRSEDGSIAQICNDDHCYVLYLGGAQPYRLTSHWFKEAVEALKKLPLPQ